MSQNQDRPSQNRGPTIQDRAAATVLNAVTEHFAGIEGPISSRVASGALMALSGLLRERRGPLPMQTLEAIMGLIVAIREDLAA